MSYSDSSYLYGEMASHLNYLYEGKVMHYLSPYGGATAIKVKEVYVDYSHTKHKGMSFANVRFKVLSKSGNIYDMDDLYAIPGSELDNDVLINSTNEL